MTRNRIPVHQAFLITALACVTFRPAVRGADGSAGQQGDLATIEVTVKLRTGGQLAGPVVDHNQHGLILLNGRTAYVFAYVELDTGSAYATKRELLAFERGGRDRLSGADHFALGEFALRLGRNDLAAVEFRKARRLDPSFKERVRRAFADFRERSRQRDEEASSFSGPAADRPGAGDPTYDEPPGDATDRLTGSLSEPAAVSSTDRRDRVMAVYRTFGEKVQEVIGQDVTLVETEHFLIWTDWEPQYRDRLAEWSEAMYAALCKQFDRNPESSIFLAKCPVFCFRSKPQFEKFAQYFDGYAGKNAVGYTRSIEANGHVHVVLLRQGNLQADFDRFACTLVHEGTHAFVHRLDGSRLIPHWVNEGLAELMSDRVLGGRCPSAGNAAMLARWYVRHDWPIEDLLHSTNAIGVEQYALAHSLIAFLEESESRRFSGFVESLKKGVKTDEALAQHYAGLSLHDLERRWREHIRSTCGDERTTRLQDDRSPAAGRSSK